MTMSDEGTETITVVVIDAHPIIRTGVEFLLSEQPQIQLKGGAEGFEAAIPLIEAAKPGVLIVGARLPIEGDLWHIHDLRQRNPGMGVVIFTTLEESVYGERCFHAGAHAYVLKHKPIEQLLQAIRCAAHGGYFCTEELKSLLLKRAASGTRGYELCPSENLSGAESNVLGLIGKGKTTQQIASVLGVSVKTIETYRLRMKRKLGLRSSSQLMHFAITRSLER